MVVYFASLAQTKTEIKANEETNEAAILARVGAISERIVLTKECPFEPNIETRTFDAGTGQDHISNDGRTLYLRYPLLTVTSITLGDSTVLTTDQYATRPQNRTPAIMLTLKQSAGLRWTVYTDSWEDAISITGLWGYRHRYATAWLTGSTLNGGISSSDTTVAVASGTPFSPGHLIRVDTEYMRVAAVSSNNLTVERGVNGSTAAAHLTTAAVSIFEWEPVVNRATLRWAAYLYSRLGSFESTTFDGVTAVSLPTDIPDEAKGLLSTFYNSKGFKSVGKS